MGISSATERHIIKLKKIRRGSALSIPHIIGQCVAELPANFLNVSKQSKWKSCWAVRKKNAARKASPSLFFKENTCPRVKPWTKKSYACSVKVWRKMKTSTWNYRLKIFYAQTSKQVFLPQSHLKSLAQKQLYFSICM